MYEVKAKKTQEFAHISRKRVNKFSSFKDFQSVNKATSRKNANDATQSFLTRSQTI